MVADGHKQEKVEWRVFAQRDLRLEAPASIPNIEKR